MNNKFKKIGAILLCFAITLAFSGTSKIVYADTGVRTMSLVDELAGSLDAGFTSNKILINVDNGSTNQISAIQVCMTNLVLTPDLVQGIEFDATVDSSNATITGLLGGSFQKINGNDHCFVYQNLSDGLVAANTTENAVKITITDQDEVTTALTEDSSLNGNDTINTDTYTVSANVAPLFDTILIEVNESAISPDRQQKTFDLGNGETETVWMSPLYKDGVVQDLSGVVRDNPYIYFVVTDPTDTKTNVIQSSSNDFTLVGNGNKKFLNETKEGFYGYIESLGYATLYENLGLKVYDDQMNAFNATNLTGLSFSTELDEERPTSVMDAVMTIEANVGSTIEFTASTDNSAVQKYYLFERGALETANVFDGNSLNSDILRTKVELLKIAEIGTTGRSLVFNKDTLTTDNSSDINSISNNRFLVVAMDDATSLDGLFINNFSEVNDLEVTPTWYHVDREGDVNNDGMNNSVDVVRMARFILGASEAL